jgi:NSS family neurotransmitter:Na+ symporter
MIVAVANSAFSLIAGFAVFAMVGNLALVEGVPVEEMSKSGGTGLAFIVIASAMDSFGGAKNVMAVLFFVMLFTLGFDSAVAWTETVISIVEDLIDMKNYKKLPLWQLSLAVCSVSYVLGLVYATRKGNEILDVVDHYVGIVFLLVVCFIEALILNFEFGWRRLALSLKSATIGLNGLPEGRTIFPTYLCRFDFHIAVPAMTAGLALYTLINDLQEPYGGYPSSILIWGWTLLAICLCSVFLTLWKQEKGELPPIEDDPKFAEVLEDSTHRKDPADISERGGSANEY